jgi:hypothetical protein
MDPAHHFAAQGRNGERLLLDPPFVPEVARENAQAIAALLKFTSIGVEKLQTEITFRVFEGAEQNPIRSDTVMTITYQPYPRGSQCVRNVGGMAFSVKALASPFCNPSRATPQYFYHSEGSSSDVARIHQPMA